MFKMRGKDFAQFAQNSASSSFEERAPQVCARLARAKPGFILQIQAIRIDAPTLQAEAETSSGGGGGGEQAAAVVDKQASGHLASSTSFSSATAAAAAAPAAATQQRNRADVRLGYSRLFKNQTNISARRGNSLR